MAQLDGGVFRVGSSDNGLPPPVAVDRRLCFGNGEAALRGPGQALADLVGIMREGPPQGEVDTVDVRSSDHGAAAEPPSDAYVF